MTGRMKKWREVQILLLTMIFLLLSVMIVDAEEPRFQLDIDNTSLIKGVSTNLVLVLENAHNARLIEIQGLENFDIMSQSSSSSTQIINGSITRSQRYNYVIMPLVEGDFSLKAIVEYNSNKYKSNELKLTVREGSKIEENEISDLFLKCSLDQKEVYFGEKIALIFELYSRYNIEGYGFIKPLDLTGFITREIPQDQLRRNYLELNGKRYAKYDVNKYILMPTGTGVFSIPATSFQVNVSTGNFFDSYRPIYLQTEPVEFNIKPLPEEGKPDKFCGLVGKLEASSFFNEREVKYGDSLTLKVKLSGTCNLDNLARIFERNIPGLSVYETEKNRVEEIRDGGYFASKEFDIILVPERTGRIEIPVVEIPYFNPETERYEKVIIEGANIQVIGDSEVFREESIDKIHPLESVETIMIEQVSYTIPDVDDDYFYIKLKRANLEIALYLIIIAIIFGFIIFFACKYWKRTDNRLRNIYKKVKRENNKQELFQLLDEMIKYRYNISLKVVSRERMQKEITNKKILENILSIMDSIENKDYEDRDSRDIKKRIKKIYQDINQDIIIKKDFLDL